MSKFCHIHCLYLILVVLLSLHQYSISTDANDKLKQNGDEEDLSSVDKNIHENIQSDHKTAKTENGPPPLKSKENIIKYNLKRENADSEYKFNDDIHSSENSKTPFINMENSKIVHEDENDTPLTPEMEHANSIYHQAMKLINGTTNRQYQTAYKLLKQAANMGHNGAKEEMAFAHILGIHLPMDFNRAQSYFDEGILGGSPDSHYGLYFLNSVGLISNSSISKALVHLVFAAADGSHLAQMALGYRYWRAVNVPQSCESALMYYEQVATYVASKITTSSGQLIHRIRLHDEEENPTQNNVMLDNNLFQYYQLLADRGDPQAQFGLGQLYYLRDSAFDKALYYFRLAAENGNVNALAYLGKIYSEKNDFVTQNYQTAVQYFQRATEKGNAVGQAGLGLAYYYGTGVEQNYGKALRLFQLSADQSYGEGQLMLGIMYYNGLGVPRDFKIALKWFQAASQSGHVLAYYNLAQMHAMGIGVLRSCTTATELFKIVAERGKWSNMFIDAFHLYRQGHVEQAFMIYLYLAEIGFEVAQSNVAFIIDQMSLDISNIYKTNNDRYKRALVYWNRAAVQGFNYARVKLGDYYYYGHGTEQNYELAANNYKYAVDQNQNSQAMFNLGYMHEKGLGLKKDKYLAKRFYDMAVETNSEAYLPVTIVLLKLHIELFFEKFFSNLFSFTQTEKASDKKESYDHSSQIINLETAWDLYLIAALLGLIGALYTIRRQRAALQQQAI